MEVDGFSLHAAVRFDGCNRARLEKLHPDCHHAGPEMAAYRDDHVGGSRLARRNRHCPSGLRHRSRLGGAR
jgi:hypothetical protein